MTTGEGGEMFTVKYSVKGASRVNTREFATRSEAEKFAARWRASNSTGSYMARVIIDPEPGEYGYEEPYCNDPTCSCHTVSQ